MGAVSELSLCFSSGYPISGGGDMSAKIPFSECRRIIREAREYNFGYKFPDAWAAWLCGYDWYGCADFEIGSCDFKGWAGLWVLDHSDMSSPFRLFRDLRDVRATCAVLVESGDGSVSAWVETRAVELVEADLIAQYCESSYCAVCGGNVCADDSLEWRDNTVCHGCATVCVECGDVELDDNLSGAVVVVDEDTGSHGYLCGSCLESASE